MGGNARHSRLFYLLFICLFLLAPALLFAQAQASPGEEKPAPKHGSFRLLSQKEMDAVFAKGIAASPADLIVARRANPGRIILWDEGPMGAARHMSISISIKNEERQGR